MRRITQVTRNNGNVEITVIKPVQLTNFKEVPLTSMKQRIRENLKVEGYTDIRYSGKDKGFYFN